MKFLAEFLILIVIIVGLMWLIVKVKKTVITPTYKGSDNRKYTTYFIDFKGVQDIPELSKNRAFCDVAMIKFKTSHGYAVASSINDTKLRKLIMNEYHLKLKNVIVTYRQMTI